jgi:hypothetical protein
MAIGNAIAVAATLLAIAGVLIAIITSSQKRHRSKVDMLRTAMESGVALSPELIDKVMHPQRTAASKQALPRGQGACVAGIIVIAFAAGYAIFACFIGVIAPTALLPMLGVACLLGCTGIGLLVVSWVLRSERSATDPRE